LTPKGVVFCFLFFSELPYLSQSSVLEAGQGQGEVIREALATGDGLAQSQEAHSPNQNSLPGLYAANVQADFFPACAFMMQFETHPGVSLLSYGKHMQGSHAENGRSGN